MPEKKDEPVMTDAAALEIAYFSMEIGVDPGMPTYAGGLGVLAGDILRCAADLEIPMVGVSLLHRQGYFRQRLDPGGGQREDPAEWRPEDFLRELPARVKVSIENREVSLRAWRFDVKGEGGRAVPVLFLDADLPENSGQDRRLTDHLYGGDQRYRLSQEILLGIGGVRMLRALGCAGLTRFHMNEGHAALLALELMDERARLAGRGAVTLEDADAVRKLCVFTTHTPVSAGQDQFDMGLVSRVLNREEIHVMREVFCCENVLNMTFLALNLSGYVNGVAKRHGETAGHMFARYPIHAITNGVHASTWTSEAFRALYDRHIPDWRKDNFSLRHALSVDPREIWEAHRGAKVALLDEVLRRSGVRMDPETLTVGFGRRATGYKRVDLIFRDVERLKSISARVGRLQMVFAGKAHPQDEGGKDLIRRVYQAKERLKDDVPVVYLEDYDMTLAGLMSSGVDVWLNTPQPPLEASGTSGMKAALNGVPSLSVRDGWWLEGHIEGVTGWAVGTDAKGAGAVDSSAQDAASLYEKLEKTIVPCYYRDRGGFLGIMRHVIALNGSYFNTQRMLQQYVLRAYFK